MMSRSGGLNPSAVAGRPSVTRLTQSSWTGIKASGNPRAAVRKILFPRKERRERLQVIFCHYPKSITMPSPSIKIRGQQQRIPETTYLAIIKHDTQFQITVNFLKAKDSVILYS